MFIVFNQVVVLFTVDMVLCRLTVMEELSDDSSSSSFTDIHGFVWLFFYFSVTLGLIVVGAILVKPTSQPRR